MADQFVEAQSRRLARFGISRSVDIHCHCLPGMDDGPGNMEESLWLCAALVADGITDVIATPHQLGRYDEHNLPGQVMLAVAELRRELDRHGMPLRVWAGADVRVDERLNELLQEDRVLRLPDGGSYVLVELPSQVLIDPLPLLDGLRQRGLRAIITHPERHEYLSCRPDLVWTWARYGALLQVTAGSLTGEFGATIQREAWQWLDSGLVSLVASDAHGVRHRRPQMTEAIDAITQRLGAPLARRLCLENPLRVLEGQQIPACVTGLLTPGMLAGATSITHGRIRPDPCRP